ncbi:MULTISPECIES: hypothetical protein [unclassified Thioalkalivibrio]|uniref:hypothetical protein n=1 Tax=unclassified Thioalkalivibrio TaxID=2621013 RepID=UPI0003791F52|nr:MULTISPECIES: hypothetical protein [unclassified Thioalkalivibrio]
MPLTPFSRSVLAALASLTLAAPGAAAAQWTTSDDESAWGMDVSLILEGIYYNELSHGNDSPAGFDDGHDHGHGNGDDHGLDDGFNLGHSELGFQARLGDLLDATVIIEFDDQDIEVDEAYLTTRALPGGLQLKAGKFLSDIGYINNRHPHEWDFVNRPLVNEYLFGDHGLLEKGVQATWLAPTATYTQLGVELLQGETSGIANYEGSQSSLNDQDRILRDRSGPRLVTAFAKIGPDLGPDHAAQFGVSGGYARSYQVTDEHSTRFEDWDGSAWFAGLDAVYKYSAGRAYGHGDWRLQGEYFYREIDVDRRDVNFEADGNGPVGFVRNEQSFKNQQDGIYVQGVYGFAPRWEAGLRAEALGLSNDVGRGDGESFGTSYRHTAQVTFRPVEPVFLRAQLSQNDFVDDHGDRDRGLEFLLQLNVALGAHGAHRF